MSVEPNPTDRWANWAAATVPMTPGWHLRPLTETDSLAVAASVDDHVRRGLLMDRAFGVAEAGVFTQQTMPALTAQGRGAAWGIAKVASVGHGGGPWSIVRGVITAHALPGNRARVGFWLGPESRGRGIAAAALRALVGHTTGHGGLAAITWASAVGNVDSLRVVKAAGFRPVGTAGTVRAEGGPLLPSWTAEFTPGTHDDRLWAQCLVEIAAGAWQLQPMDATSSVVAESILPVSACVPTGVWAAKEITSARVDAVAAMLLSRNQALVLALPASPSPEAADAATAAAEVVRRYARRALGLITP